jgi:hypothetical protein
MRVRMIVGSVLVAGLALLAAAAPADDGLEVVQAAPAGEVASLAEAGEIRVVFSEPMVVLGRVPEPVRADFFVISPPVAGALRWSGTTTLVFTPRDPLPFATRYDVTIDASAAAVSGARLERPYRFHFTTPRLRVRRVSWYRTQGRPDSPLMIGVRFNQPVRGEEVATRLRLERLAHPFTPPALPAVTRERLRAEDARAEADFEARVLAARAAAGARGAEPFDLASSWDEKRFPPGEGLVVLKTRGAPAPGTWLGLGQSQPGSPSGPEAPDYVLKTEPAFFVTGLRCTDGCDPEGWNALTFPLHVKASALRGKVRVLDVTEPGRETPVEPQAPEAESDYEWTPDYGDGNDWDRSSGVSLEELGFHLLPARTYLVRLDRSAQSSDGQALGYTWLGRLENWHRRAFSSFGAGNGVWERDGGPVLPFYARNLRSLTEWVVPLTPEQLLPTLQSLQKEGFAGHPPAAGVSRALKPKPDETQSFGMDLKPQLGPAGTGLVWAALQDGETIPRAYREDGRPARARSSLIQVTNLGITVKDSPQTTLVLVTRLDDGAPVEGARVTIRDKANAVVWTGTTDGAGVALAQNTALRTPDGWWQLSFLVTAEKDGDVAYAASDWTDGVEPWNWGLSYDLEEAKPLLRGTVFTDRGVYKLGEEVRLKAILRSDTGWGMQLLSGKPVEILVVDSQANEIDKRTVRLSEWSSADWTLALPADGPLGHYRVSATLAGQNRIVETSFLVAAYRRPEFRVDASLATDAALAGAALRGVVAGRYLFGPPMARRPVRWSFTRRPVFDVPAAIRERYPEERWAFLDAEDVREPRGSEVLQSNEGETDAKGVLELSFETERASGRPYEYGIEGEVTDLSRQTLAGRAALRVDAAPFYVGLLRPGYFCDLRQALETSLVAASLAGPPVGGIEMKVTLTQVQWNSVRRAEGAGYYTWETERVEVPAGEWTLTSAGEPVPLRIPLERGGFYVLRATAGDAEGRTTTTATSFYAVGPGYTAWERYDHNRIDLVAEKASYRVGETARILVKSPWEQATALLTTEREGIRTFKSFALSSTQETVEVPISESYVPNVYVSVVLVKGRSARFSPQDTSDPGKPAFRVGYLELKVEDAGKLLDVSVTADREEYRPGATARVDVHVRDAKGPSGPAEVTLWAVDYGVLSLTAFKAPDVRRSVWIQKALQVLTQDSRQNIISRRVLSSKGATEGGGLSAAAMGGVMAEAVRKDFRPLAFWLGSVVTDAQGRATREVTLPESLTTYRVIAVAGDKASRFGAGEREIRTSKPVLVRPTFPRFLARGDEAHFGAIVQSQLPEAGTAIVSARSLDPALLDLRGEPIRTLEVAAKGSAEVRFDFEAKGTGRARLEVSVKLLGEQDAFEEVVPVTLVATPEVVAAYGQAGAERASEGLALPSGVVPGYGGLRIETASTALVGLGEGARYLVDYPFGCAEQRASAALALGLAADLGQAFALDLPEDAAARARATFRELEGFQCDSGGFAFWKGSCGSASPYLTAYLLHVLQRAHALGHAVTPAVLEKAAGYLETSLGQDPPANESWWPAYTAWQAFAVRTLATAGRNVDSHLTRLYAYADRMPVFALAYLLDAMEARGETGARPDELAQRLRNAILPEGGTAHVEELSDPWLLWFWNSNVRSTAIVLRTLVRRGSDDVLVPRLVRWLMLSRVRGRWGNTQENAHALEALVDYYRKHEAEPPDFRAVVKLGLETLQQEEFRGRTTEARHVDVPLADLSRRLAPGETQALSFERDGTGTLHYMTRLRYALEGDLAAADAGFAIERRYERATAEGKADPSPAAGSGLRYRAGDLVRVTLALRLTKERRFVAVEDPLPAGFEPVESWFATTASDLAREVEEGEAGGKDWMGFWQRGGFEHVERRDDRVRLFATRLAAGEHVFSYVARATTAGVFRVGPARAEEMYSPEISGRTASAVVEVRP